jgi:hypothetical protein
MPSAERKDRMHAKGVIDKSASRVVPFHWLFYVRDSIGCRAATFSVRLVAILYDLFLSATLTRGHVKMVS